MGNTLTKQELLEGTNITKSRYVNRAKLHHNLRERSENKVPDMAGEVTLAKQNQKPGIIPLGS